ncbi:nuclear transport factor 2 family protein [Streptomyces sp. MBT65]|uniref:nuclear transport factor 2 family protein n=1 Tax=Streptomyces sp. MBT65 TaxID=1488395 RepID=UPI00190CF5CD|nr:nuclear transport factor 2 family protein [Streptomyces sp. MBT65]MBK3580728.1 nuclear transport factor 2 family protein [Streptomyces sp. MBT65]
MTRTTLTTTANETVIDRYMRIFDRTVYQPEALKELESIFTPDATVDLGGDMEPVTGMPEIMAAYGQLTKALVDSKHFWTVTELDDGRLECHWVQAGRATDGRLAGQSGIEQVTVNADGRITHLSNRMVPIASWS